MRIKSSHYEALLAQYSDAHSLITLLKQYRPYLEMVPSMRRPQDSLIAIPLPIIRVRDAVSHPGHSGISVAAGEAVCLPCDVAILMCDPEWKVKTGIEIFIFIHRPEEDFSSLLGRWRQTQVWLDKGYEWLMPHRYRYIISEEAENIYPLFVLLEQTPERIKRGLNGASLPFVIDTLDAGVEEEEAEEESESFSTGNSQA